MIGTSVMKELHLFVETSRRNVYPELFLELHIVVIAIPNLIQISLIKSTSSLFPVCHPLLINIYLRNITELRYCLSGRGLLSFPLVWLWVIKLTPQTLISEYLSAIMCSFFSSFFHSPLVGIPWRIVLHSFFYAYILIVTGAWSRMIIRPLQVWILWIHRWSSFFEPLFNFVEVHFFFVGLCIFSPTVKRGIQNHFRHLAQTVLLKLLTVFNRYLLLSIFDRWLTGFWIRLCNYLLLHILRASVPFRKLWACCSDMQKFWAK